MPDGMENGDAVLAGERKSAGKALVQNRAKGPYVSLRADKPGLAVGLLGSHVARCAHE